MFTNLAKTMAAGAALIAAASPASAATFNLTSVGPNQGSMWSFEQNRVVRNAFTSAMVDGIQFTAIGYSTADTNIATLPEIASIGRWDGGLGVINGYEGNGANGQHTIDNTYRYDFVALVFNKQVQMTGLTLNAYLVDGKGPDKDAWIGNGTLTDGMTADAQFAEFQRMIGSPVKAMDGVMPNAQAMSGRFGNVWLIGADRTTVTADRNDGFKLGAISAVAAPNVTAVPEPATWATMMLGFGLAGAAIRRRRTTVAFAA